MKYSDIDTLGKVLLALEEYLPFSEKELLDEFTAVFERLNIKNNKEKQAYKDKAEYHRDYTRSWEKRNPEKRKQYSKAYNAKKKRKKNDLNNANPSQEEAVDKILKS